MGNVIKIADWISQWKDVFCCDDDAGNVVQVFHDPSTNSYEIVTMSYDADGDGSTNTVRLTHNQVVLMLNALSRVTKNEQPPLSG
jgi:hypothetical protein